jgi:hypothetical protein
MLLMISSACEKIKVMNSHVCTSVCHNSIQRIIIVWCDRTVCRGLSHSNMGTFRLINRSDSGFAGREGDGKLFWTFQVFIDTFVLQSNELTLLISTVYVLKYTVIGLAMVLLLHQKIQSGQSPLCWFLTKTCF